MRMVVAFVLSFLVSFTANAQSVLDELEAKITARADELLRAEKLLSHPDPNTRLAAMEQLIGSSDPAFVQKAKEVGLFSSDPRLREAAIRGVFDAGGGFSAEFILNRNKTDMTDIYTWLRNFKGSWSVEDNKGYFGFALGRFDNDQQCWLWLNSRKCVFRMAGEKVMTVDWSFNIIGSSVMQLDDKGNLTGAFLVNGRGIPVIIRIPLID